MKHAVRDGRIESARFIFCLLIVCFHSYLVCGDAAPLFPYGYIFVEFFFFLSGYFTARHFASADAAAYCGHEARTALIYTARKLVPVWICSFAVVLARTLLDFFTEGGTAAGLLRLLAVRFPEAALLNIFWPEAAFCTPPLWFAAALLAALPVLIYLMLRLSDFFKHLIAWMLPLFFYGIACYAYGTLQSVYFFVPAILRALAGLCAGCCAFWLGGCLRALRASVLLRALLTAAAGAALAGAILLAAGVSGRHDFLTTALLFVFLTALMSDQTYLRPFQSRLTDFLGALTLPMYIGSYLAGELAADCLPGASYGARLLLMLALTALIGLLLYGLIALMRKIDWKRALLAKEKPE